jgi:hypothetical protein
MKVKKNIIFEFRDVYGTLKETRTYTIVFGDYYLIKTPLSGNPYWYVKEDADNTLATIKGSVVIDKGTVYVENVGTYYRDESEFIQAMGMLRAKPKL